jgi:hypothetical protein
MRWKKPQMNDEPLISWPFVSRTNPPWPWPWALCGAEAVSYSSECLTPSTVSDHSRYLGNVGSPRKDWRDGCVEVSIRAS